MPENFLHGTLSVSDESVLFMKEGSVHILRSPMIGQVSNKVLQAAAASGD